MRQVPEILANSNAAKEQHCNWGFSIRYWLKGLQQSAEVLIAL